MRALDDDGFRPRAGAADAAAGRSASPRAVVAVDEEGGDVTRIAHLTGSPYPGNAALGAVDHPKLTHAVHRALAAALGWVPFFVLATAACLPSLLLLVWIRQRPPAAAASRSRRT